MGRLLLNCDLGEGESAGQTAALMQCVDAANICCGVHAGSLEKTRETMRLAQEFGVQVGAHPGLAVAGGRGSGLPTPAGFEQLLSEQLGSFFESAQRLGVDVHHIKLHGSLYSAVETDADLAAVYLQRLSAWPGVKVFALAGGAFTQRALDAGITVVPELFADRGYLCNGMLVPRSELGAMIHSVEAAVARIRIWQETGSMPSVQGEPLPLPGETLCVHSDSRYALDLLEALHDLR